MIPGDKRITLVCGHYGSGKSSIALQFAFDIKKRYANTAIADIDIVNPYFRSADAAAELERAGIRLITSQYAGTNLDAPALPGSMYSLTDDRDIRAVIDVGGDDRGALALGRWAERIAAEDDYEMLLVINMYRPLTREPGQAAAVMREIEGAARLRFTGIVNNSNLGAGTTADDVLRSVRYAQDTAAICGLPLRLTTVSGGLLRELKGKIPDLYPIAVRNQIIQ